MARRDPHSYADDAQPRIAALRWRVRIDAAARLLDGEATYELSAPGGGVIDLDARGQALIEARGLDGSALSCEVGPTDPILGNRVRVTLPPGARGFLIRHRTLREPLALGFDPSCVYALCQPIQARSLLPLVDTPRARLALAIEVDAPAGWLVIAPAGTETIPSYLLTLVAGRFESRELSPRSRVHAPPSLLEVAAQALAFVEPLIAEAEQRFGAYPWARFDLALMPPSFPHGGMEGPTLVLLSPTVLDDPEDLRRVVTHELLHAWFGNLVTAASAEHLWLNEGWTVWAERRLSGDPAAWARGWRELHVLFGELSPERTHLRLPLAGVAPEEAASMIAYEKGALLLARLEHSVGAQRFGAFAHAYLAHFRQRAVDSDEFRAFADDELGDHGVDLVAWIDGPGLPADAPRPTVAAPEPRPEDVPPLVEHAEEIVQRFGRLQLIRPLWLALAKKDPARAGALFRKVAPDYHPSARSVVETLLRRAGVAIREVNPLGLGLRR